jgi:hypothetical protein
LPNFLGSRDGVPLFMGTKPTGLVTCSLVVAVMVGELIDKRADFEGRNNECEKNNRFRKLGFFLSGLGGSTSAAVAVKLILSYGTQRKQPN